MTAIHDDLSREVYGVLGIPLDRADMDAVLCTIEAAIARATPFLISTPNLNFLVNSWLDSEFNESLLRSDLCSADGMPVVWLARLLGIPIKERTAGSDLFEALKSRRPASNPIKVFFFGSAEGIAEAASQRLNAAKTGMICVGFHYPGFGPVEDMSSDAVIDAINASGADFLIIALGAMKGQLWLMRNHHRLSVPVRSHLGAVINFQARRIERAPLFCRKYGLEWLWRVSQEPKLWRRYWYDGHMLLWVFVSRALALAVGIQWRRLRNWRKKSTLFIEQAEDQDAIIIKFVGDATTEHVFNATTCLRSALDTRKRVVINLSATNFIDSRFIGLLLMLQKTLRKCGQGFELVAIAPHVRKTICRNGFGFLLAVD